jgi:hypothetical protein
MKILNIIMIFIIFTYRNEYQSFYNIEIIIKIEYQSFLP